MSRQRFSAEFKAKVAMEAIKNNATVPELAQRLNVHPSQIQRWKSDLITRSKELFLKESNKGKGEDKTLGDLERKVGQLTMENDFLKKNLSGYRRGND